MVWFYCDDCGDSLKKPKLQNHFSSCSASSFTCIDCSRTFDRNAAKNHITCVSEHDKYALGATKPGGYAANGFFQDGAQPKPQQGPVGTEHLTTRPPWRCNLCNVTCTSKDVLLGHASGAKHTRRARAAAAANGAGEAAPAHGGAAENNGGATQPAAAHGALPVVDVPSAAAPAQAAGKNTKNKRVKWKALSTAVLQAKGGTMKVSKLQKRVLARAGLQGPEAVQQLMAAVGKSSRFVVTDSHIKLASS